MNDGPTERATQDPTAEQIRVFLGTLAPVVDYTLALGRELDRKLARRFSPFDYLRRDEMGLSRILADLLSPTGAHGQGDLFLGDLLERVGLKGADTRGAKVRTEAPLRHASRAGRIDILVEGADWSVAIENKPRAIDQPRQLARYWKEVRTRPGGEDRARLVYISGAAEPPHENSISAAERDELIGEGKLFLFAFAGGDGDRHIQPFLPVIEHWARRAEAPRVRGFLEELALFLRREFAEETEIMDHAELKALADLVLSGDALARPAFMLAEAVPAIRARLLGMLLTGIEKRLTGLPEGWACEKFVPQPSDLGRLRGEMVLLSAGPRQGSRPAGEGKGEGDARVGLAISGADGALDIGIRAPSWEKAFGGPGFREALLEALDGLGQKEKWSEGPWWPIYRRLDEFGPGLYHPSALAKMYLALHPDKAREGEAVPDLDRIAEEIVALARALERALSVTGRGAAS